MIKVLLTLINKTMSKFKNVLENIMNQSSKLLEEMPAASKVTKFDLDKTYKKIFKKLKHVGDFESLKVMRSTDSGVTHDFLVDESNTPVLYNSYKISEGFGIFEKAVFQDHRVKGLARRWYVNYILPTHNVIVSDEDLTTSGLEFYAKLFDLTTIKVIDTDTKQVGSLDTPEELYDYFGVGQERFRYMIYKKQ